MNFLTGVLSPTAMRLMALTLLHFLWQGTALAALAYAGMTLCQRSASRYAVGLTILVMMAAAPGITYLTLQRQESGGAALVAKASDVTIVAVAPAKLAKQADAAPVSDGVPGYFLLLVEIWFAGVMLLGLRSAGGVIVVERMRRRESNQVGEQLREVCLMLQRKMGLQRLVKFYECNRLDAPAVVGWLRPVVMLPVTALTGLSEAQLASVIAHELAHIKRYDALVNLFQISVETLLFYHPGVWWLNKKIREERENCCDDTAVEVCGNPLMYAHALARMAESRMSPTLLMAVNGRPLAARVARLLGMGKKPESVRGADLSLGVLCLSASLMAGLAFIGVARNVHAQTPVAPTAPAAPSPAPSVAAANVPKSAILVRPMVAPVPVEAPSAPPTPVAAEAVAPLPVPEVAAVAMPQAPPAPTAPQNPSSSYIDGLKAAGLENLSVDDVIALKIQGVTPEYVKSMKDLGMRMDADELVGMKIQNVTPEYVRDMRAATGQKLEMDELVGMKVQGITPEYVKQFQELGLKVDADELVGMKIQGVTPEYVKSINALGLHPGADELIGMKVQGVDAEYLKKLQAAGITLDVDEAIGAKVIGVTPEFIENARAHGFKDLTLEQLIGLKQSGALDDTKH
jgi:beta-lactamase regulating signal transducer with metallopeptidase domain